MSVVKESRLKVVDLPVEKIRPNGWNVNRIPDHLYAKLREYVRREGLIEPLVVRPAEAGMHELVGGEHRWRVAQELGWKHVPCAVVELDDRRARIASLNLNSLKGDAVPALLADLVHELSREVSLPDLASQLPWATEELEDLQSLLQIPDGLDAALQEEAERMERERPRVISFALSPKQEQIVEAAIERSLAEVAGTSRGAALTHIARTYLEREGGDEE
jgi:ParB family chromosome partitioning protein